MQKEKVVKISNEIRRKNVVSMNGIFKDPNPINAARIKLEKYLNINKIAPNKNETIFSLRNYNVLHTWLLLYKYIQCDIIKSVKFKTNFVRVKQNRYENAKKLFFSIVLSTTRKNFYEIANSAAVKKDGARYFQHNSESYYHNYRVFFNLLPNLFSRECRAARRRKRFFRFPLFVNRTFSFFRFHFFESNRSFPALRRWKISASPSQGLKISFKRM